MLRFPFNLRPLLGIKKMVHTKAVSDFVSSGCILYAQTNDPTWRDFAAKALGNLNELSIKTKHGKGFGLKFPFATRFIQAGPETPNIFQTINAAHAYLDAYDYLEKNNVYLEQTFELVEFLEKDLGFEKQENTIWWHYWEGLTVQIFNVNGLTAGLYARLFKITGQEKFRQFAEGLCNFLEKNQETDGSWKYAAGGKADFVDGFHTGYILEGLSRCVLSGIISKESKFLKLGVDYYLNNLFNEAGTPKYFNNRLPPFDAQNFAQAIQTLTFLNYLNFADLDLPMKVFEKAVQLFWKKPGFFSYSPRSTAPMHRWATGPMLLSQAYLMTIKHDQ